MTFTSKTVSFTGRQIAKMLNISGVHGKFYQRLKLAILGEGIEKRTARGDDPTSAAPTPSTATTATEGPTVVELEFRGFGGRYMELDGLTAKHLYRFLAVPRSSSASASTFGPSAGREDTDFWFNSSR